MSAERSRQNRIGRGLPPIQPAAARERRAPRSFACTPCEKVERSRAMRWSHALERRLQTLFQGANHEPARKARITKAHFRLGRMDIDIDLARIAIEKQDKGWMPPLRHIIHVSARTAPMSSLSRTGRR